MKTNRLIFKLLLILALIACALPVAFLQATVPPTPATTPTASDDPDKPREAPGLFYSSRVGDTFKIFISLPEGYEPEGSRTYPVVYLLDGNWYFRGPRASVMGIALGLTYKGRIPPIILVGIGYPATNQRGRDFLIAYDKFYAFLVGELIPFVDAHYKTDAASGRTLIGHSDGGFFTFYAFTSYGEKPGAEPFNKFISISGDFTKLGHLMSGKETALYNRSGENGILDVSLYMAVGEKEEKRFVESNQKMWEILASRNYAGFKFQSKVYDQKDHTSVVSPAVSDGLVWVFKDTAESIRRLIDKAR
jgi:enterochelin esterase-like enzyme